MVDRLDVKLVSQSTAKARALQRQAEMSTTFRVRRELGRERERERDTGEAGDVVTARKKTRVQESQT